ncbi:hypothetical protein, conserved [Plasmodium gonderi]|uniref:Uncharacterized protein n=1 Tax=Plasmodium gonderi TaxID=77519 RepID=A0A1Y1JB10_PLAGO|nr:hypothetical protein, conserved [Plasmodium gonderi]GAW79440.1 hypothetical protein, conserved [Plasmodium gonderi]
MKHTTVLLKVLLLVAITIQEGLLSWQIMTNRTMVIVIDIGLLMLFLYLQISSENNTQMYMIYIYSIVTKITIIYYVSLPKCLINEKEEVLNKAEINLYWIRHFDNYTNKIHMVSIAILISIIVYILFFYITDFNLLKVHFINLEILFCSLIISHVSIDFMDISDFFYSINFHFFLYHFRVIHELSIFKDTNIFVNTSIDHNTLIEFYTFCLNSYQVIFILFGVLLCINISIHAYSLPTYSYETTKKGIFINGELSKSRDPNNNSRKYPHVLSDYNSSLPLLHLFSYKNVCNRMEKTIPDEILASARYDALTNGSTYGTHGNPTNVLYLKRRSYMAGLPPVEADCSCGGPRKGGSSPYSSTSSASSASSASSTSSSSSTSSTSSACAPLHLRSKVGGDAMSCLKYLSIYSFLFTDVSLFTARVFLYLIFSGTACSPLFIAKNLCFAIIHGSRIYRKSKFYNHRKKKERRKRKKKTKKWKNATNEYTENCLEKGIERVKTHTAKMENKQKSFLSTYGREEKSFGFKKGCLSNEFLSRSFISRDTININRIEHADYDRIDSLNYNKIRPHFHFQYLKYNGINFKRHMSCYVDKIENNCKSYLMIFLFFFILIATKIAILVVTYTLDIDDDLNQHLYELTYQWNINAVNSCWILKINLFIIFVYSFCSFILYIITCSIFDGVFMFLLYSFNLLSYFFALIIMTQYNPACDIFDYFNKSKNTLVVLLAFAHLAYLFLEDTYMFIYMLLGRKYITYRCKSKMEKSNETQRRVEENEELFIPISIVSSFMLKLIKHMKGPIILNRIIIGKNFIKNARLDNFLYICHIKEIIIKLVFYLFCFFLALRSSIINVSFLFIIFLFNFILSLAYLFFSKADRNLAMDTIFTQALFLDLTARPREDRWVHWSGLSKRQHKKLTSQNMNEHTCLYEKYSYDHSVLFQNCLNYF